MADQEIENLIREQFALLPTELKAAIGTVNLRQQFDAIREKDALHIDEVGKLENQTILTLLGFEETETYEKRLATSLGLSPEKARSVALHANELIFLPIHEEVQKRLTREAPEKPAAEAIGMPVAARSTSEAQPERLPGITKEIPKKADPDHRRLSKDFIPENLPTDKESLLLEIENPKPDELLLSAKALSPSPALAVKEEPKSTPLPAFRGGVSQGTPRQSSGKILSPLTRPSENPITSPVLPTKDLAADKLSGTVRTPREKIDISSQKSPLSVTTSPASSHSDPYREPVE
jgi:hypothetical protein